MAEIVSKSKGKEVFEDFPLPERKHYDGHRAARGSLGAGLTPVECEKMPFAHIKRGSNQNSDLIAPASDTSFWKSSYQAMATGDDVGKVKKLSRRKKSSQNNVMSTQSNVFYLPRSFQVEQENHKVDTSDKIPGYTGHVPRRVHFVNNQSRNPADKSLLAENFRYNVVGYTGHIK